MPAPNIQVLEAMFFALYLKVDKAEGNEGIQEEGQPQSYLSWGLQKGAKIVKATRSQFDKSGPKLEEIKNKVFERIKEENTPQDWVDVEILLGNKAKEAQQVKTIQGEASRCCEILHAMRSYILMTMTSANDQYKKAHDERMSQLKKSIGDYQKKIEQYNNELGVDATLLINSQNQNIVDLAYLSYSSNTAMHIVDALRVKELDYLLSLDDKDKQLMKVFERKSSCRTRNYGIKDGLPYCMQNVRYDAPGKKNVWFWIILYDDRYRHKLNKEAVRWAKEIVDDSQINKMKKLQLANGDEDQVVHSDGTQTPVTDAIPGALHISGGKDLSAMVMQENYENQQQSAPQTPRKYSTFLFSTSGAESGTPSTPAPDASVEDEEKTSPRPQG